MGGLVRSWFRLDGRVSQRAYVATGFGLMAFKYAVEAVAIRAVTAQTWTPFDYFVPIYSLKASKLRLAPDWFLLALGLWTLPFLWIGASMTLRRARDADLGGWPLVFFFVPLFNYMVMLLLALRGPREPHPEDLQGAVPDESSPAFEAALVAVGVTAIGTLALASFATLVAKSYGGFLFLGLPFVLGFEGAYIFNRKGDRGSRATMGVVTLALGFTGLALLLFAVEGIVCVLMAFPIAWLLALFGSAFGRALALERASNRTALAPALLLVPMLCIEPALRAPPEFEVVSSVEIAALPERVWPHVIGFEPLSPPHELLFVLGIAYPTGAEIEGEGVGAIRRCRFSTGEFVEPVTAWEPPARLAFDVRAQPDPMVEWSPYARMRPPHIERSFRALRGEFRLVALSGGRTRLEGRTWYTLQLEPLPYWRAWTDWIVHRIHMRVLEHIRRLSEAADSGASH